MNPSFYRISLDIHDTTSQLSFSIKKGDTSRRLLISLMDNGVPYNISENCYAIFSAKKADGKPLFNDCTIKDNLIIYDITEQTSVSVGRVDCEIILSDINSEVITSPRFAIIVYDTVIGEYESGITSSSEYKALVELTAEVSSKLKNGEFKGEKGDRGLPGSQGIQGVQGIQGERGEKGEKGDKGDKGEKGDKGADGTIFFADLTPEQKESLKGDKGDQGIQGEKGEKGDKGDQGEKGADGKDGANGRDGADGKDGKDGADGTMTFEDLTAAQKESLKGVGVASVTYNGEWGTDRYLLRFTFTDGTYVNVAVPKPKDGADGKDGANGKDGAQGVQGIQGVQGEQGERGEKGEKGEDGEDGRGIKSISRDEDGNLVITYTDGTKQVIEDEKGSTPSYGEGINNNGDTEAYIEHMSVVDGAIVGSSNLYGSIIISGLFFDDCNQSIAAGSATELGNSPNGFQNNKGLTDIEMNNIAEIGAYAFKGCTNLVSLLIDVNVSVIGVEAFANCRSLKYINFQGDYLTFIGWLQATEFGEDWLAGTPDDLVFITEDNYIITKQQLGMINEE